MPSHESSPRRTGKILAVASVPVLAAGVAFAYGQLKGEDKIKTIGQVPGIEACGPESTTIDTIKHVRATVGYEACRTAVTNAANVIAGTPPFEGMNIVETTTILDTTFGKPSYTVFQKSAEAVDPTNTQEYRVSFAVTPNGEGDLSNIVSMTGNNGTDLGAIDHYKQGDKDVYAAGFRDPQAADAPFNYAIDNAGGAAAAQDRSKAALAAFVAWKSE